MTVEHWEQMPAVAEEGLPTAEQLVLRFLMTKRSGHTRAAYGTDLGVRLPRPGVGKLGESHTPARAPNWLAYCRAYGLDPLAVTDDQIAAWARGMEAAKLSPATVARKMASVSSWYAWLARNKKVPVNPAAELPRPEIDADYSKTPGLKKDQALTLLAYADHANTPSAPRNAAIAYLLVYTGARVSELTGATMGSLGSDRGHRVLRVRRKGSKDASLVIPPPALARLDAYHAGRSDLTQALALRGETGGLSAPLIATAAGKPVRNADVWLIMRQLARGAKLPEDFCRTTGAHSMRHTFATLSLDAGVSLRDLQDAMGHKDPRTTRRYDRARERLERSPGYKLAEFLADGE
jgi:integrase/recombinase XerD